jgi:signal transduction histidine kinase
VHIELSHSDHTTTLVVRDNGHGLAPTDPSQPHFGVQGMRERAERLGGSLEIDTPATGGVEVRARVPSPRESAEDILNRRGV